MRRPHAHHSPLKHPNCCWREHCGQPSHSPKPLGHVSIRNLPDVRVGDKNQQRNPNILFRWQMLATQAIYIDFYVLLFLPPVGTGPDQGGSRGGSSTVLLPAARVEGPAPTFAPIESRDPPLTCTPVKKKKKKEIIHRGSMLKLNITNQ